MEINVNIQATGLEKAINNLAEALKSKPTSKEIIVDAPKETLEEVELIEEKIQEKKEQMAEDAVEEVAETSNGLTFEEVRIKLAAISQKGKQKELKKLITSFGAEKLSDIPQEKYAELIEKAEEL